MDKFKLWVKAALVRAIKTFAQTALVLGGSEIVGFADLDWVFILSASGCAAVFSILTSLAGLPEVKEAEAIERVHEVIADDFDGIELTD